MTESCETCRFWKRDSNSPPWGDCRRRSPVAAAVRFPRSMIDDSCGEFEPVKIKTSWFTNSSELKVLLKKAIDALKTSDCPSEVELGNHLEEDEQMARKWAFE